MKIDGKVYCFFEQSGTFKNEFIKLGIPAEDYDIQNEFGQTDHIIDLFAEIENAYDGRSSLFDDITPDDLIVAFFPCVYFCQMSQYLQSISTHNYRHLTESQAIDKIIERQNKRAEYLNILTKFVRVCVSRNLRMIFENPATDSFLNNYFLKPPTITDKDRTMRGDVFKKPTNFWFWNCEPTHGRSFQRGTQLKRIVDCGRGGAAGIYSTERSAIAPEYARNFICDFILGKENEHTLRDLFDDGNE